METLSHRNTIFMDALMGWQPYPGQESNSKEIVAFQNKQKIAVRDKSTASLLQDKESIVIPTGKLAKEALYKIYQSIENIIANQAEILTSRNPLTKLMRYLPTQPSKEDLNERLSGGPNFSPVLIVM